MRVVKSIILPISIISSFALSYAGNNGSHQLRLTLDTVVDNLSPNNPSSKIELLNYKNAIMDYENYQKSYLPSFSMSVNPVSFNQSIQMLQQASDGTYNYVNNYSNSSTVGLTISQKIGWTGGTLSLNSSLNSLNQFSIHKNSFSATPYNITYTQPLVGGKKQFVLEKSIAYKQYQIALKNYYNKLTEIQQQSVSLFIDALYNRILYEQAEANLAINDTLLHLSAVKLNNGNITQYEYDQVLLQYKNNQYTLESARRNMQNTMRKFTTFIGVDDQDIQLLVPDINVPLIDQNTAVFYIHKNNPFILQQEIERLDAEQTLCKSILENSFNSSISLNFGKNQYGNTLSQVYKNLSTNQAVNISLQIPVFQWGINKNKSRIARNKYLSTILSLDKNKKEFEDDIKEKYDNYTQAILLCNISKEGYQLAKSQYNLGIQKFIKGKISFFDLSSIWKNEDDALKQYFSSMKDLWNNYLILRNIALYDFKNKKDLNMSQ